MLSTRNFGDWHTVFGKYHGARWQRQRWTVTASLYWTRWGIISQCRSSCFSRDRPARISRFLWPDVLQHFQHAATCSWPSARKTKQSIVNARCDKGVHQCPASDEHVSPAEARRNMPVETKIHRNSHTKKSNTAARFLPRCMECRRGLAMRICQFVSLSQYVCQTFALWQNGRKICPDFYIARKII